MKYLRHIFAMLLWGPALVMLLSGCGPEDKYLFTAGKVLYATPADFDLKYRQVSFSTRDGKLLSGWIVEGRKASPELLFFHGNDANLSDSVGYVQLLNKLGMTIFVFDYRGYGESTGEVMGEKDLYEDARSAVNYLQGIGWRPERMIYYGQSLGSALAIQMALEFPPAGLVLESSFTSFPDMARRMAPVTYRLFGWCCSIDQFDNLTKIADIRVPKLIIHGDRDTLTPIEMSRRLYERAPEPKTFYVIHDGGHCDAVRYGGSGYLNAWRQFLDSIATSATALSSLN